MAASSSSSSSAEGKMTRLVSLDGERFEVKESVAGQSQTIRHLIDDECADSEIPIPNVKGNILSKVLEFCQKHAESSGDEDHLKTWDADFVKVDQAMLFDLILAANYLDIKKLLDLTCDAVADIIKGKMPEEIRQTFNIKNDFTPEEEEKIKEEHSWAFV